MVFLRRWVPYTVLPQAWLFILGLGLFVQLAGTLFNSDGSRQATQQYLLLFVPALVLLVWQRASVSFWRQPSGLVLLSLLAWVLLSGIFHEGSLNKSSYWLKIALLILLYVYAVAHLVRYPRSFTWLLVAAVGMVALFAWLSLYYQFGVLARPIDYINIRRIRIFEMGWRGLADLQNAVVAGLYYGVFIVMSVYLFVGLKVRAWQAALLGVAVLGLATYVFVAFSRGAWISTMAGSLVMLILFPNIKSRVLIGLGFLLVIAAAIFFWPELQIEQRKGLSGRDLIWQAWFERFSEFWLLGAGPGQEFIFTFPWGMKTLHAHSLYLQLWYEYGIVGFALFVLLLLSLLWKGWTCRNQPMAKVGLALLVYVLVAMLSDIYAIFNRPNPWWVLFWFPVGILLGVQPQRDLQASGRRSGGFASW